MYYNVAIITCCEHKGRTLTVDGPLCVAGTAAEIVSALRPGPGQTAGARGLGAVP